MMMDFDYRKLMWDFNQWLDDCEQGRDSVLWKVESMAAMFVVHGACCELQLMDCDLQKHDRESEDMASKWRSEEEMAKEASELRGLFRVFE
ncbi:hypothetical protein Baya_13270 [Bagarius yarrelli]|uniref:Uncharacterized protein n=1 Tax=Bagarius yarrelli TaxID=175774 RepID=A0A556V5E9_BAGYA|nr:hypothetical protein Baya_13270 [Bagarius yarrelli]